MPCKMQGDELCRIPWISQQVPGLMPVYQWHKNEMINCVSVLKAAQSCTFEPHSHPECCHTESFSPEYDLVQLL